MPARSVMLLARFDAGRHAARAIARDRPTLTLQVPATMKALVEHPQWAATDLSCLRAVWAGSSLLPAPLVQAFHARGVPVCNVYGATETGPFSIALPPEHAFDHVGSCGWPPRRAWRCGWPTCSAAPANCGCARPTWCSATGRTLPACDAEGWFHTGDLATQATDGSYTVVGRAKDLIISGGENIHPAEIETPLAEHPAVLECAAFGVPDAQWGEAVAVALVLRPGASRRATTSCAPTWRRGLARYKLPRRCVRLDALPQDGAGQGAAAALARRWRVVAGPARSDAGFAARAGGASERLHGRCTSAIRRRHARRAPEASHTSTSTGTPRAAVAGEEVGVAEGST